MSYLAYVSFTAIGAVVGALYFLILYRTVQLHMIGAAVAHVLPLYVLRVAGAVAAFWLIAQEGAVPLLLALTGFVIARYAAQQLAKRY